MLKREIRILGLSTTSESKHQRLLVGAIFRGNFWLDGVLTCVVDLRENYLSKIIQTIVKCKQYPQTRAIISRENLLPENIYDLKTLTNRIQLPGISIIKTYGIHSAKQRFMHTAKRDEVCIGRRPGTVLVRTLNVRADVAQEIYEVGCRDYELIPEAVRIAELITNQL